ncbi:DNA polymerase III subunit beta [Nitrospira sp. BLG_2]|uniref:DNA polymerase III subunit beta n=1 Tax=Nitrospira sp. BLG_2 TaxID=3397507 RepID=UPI003B9AE5F4
MEFTISRADLVRELGLSQGVVEKRTTIPILSNVLVEASDDRITLTATDLELGIRCSCPAKVKKAGAGTIPAKRLLDYVRLLPESDIQIKVGDNHWASIVCGRSRTRIAGMSRDSYPELPQAADKVAEIPAGLFASMIGQTIFSISSEESRFTLNGALLVLKSDAMLLVATDGHRLAMTERKMDFGATSGFRALIPRKAMSEILRLAGEAGADAKIHFSATDNHLFFQMGDRLLISRKLTGNFPDYERVLPKEHPHAITLGKEEFRQAIERVSQFSDERSHAVRVHMEPGEVKVHSSLSDTGESEDSLAASYGGPSVEIGFNASYVLEFLKACPESSVTFHFKDAASAGEMRPEAAEGEAAYNYRYIIMPMRI